MIQCINAALTLTPLPLRIHYSGAPAFEPGPLGSHERGDLQEICRVTIKEVSESVFGFVRWLLA